jgi:mono/diheme cytochrome c family protein
MKRRVLFWFAGFTTAALGIVFVLPHVSISALPEPGKTESYLASRAKHAIVRGNSRGIAPPPTPNTEANPPEGEKLFGIECAVCHGMEGSTPSDAGRWMYPRAANLSAPDVQRYSDAELFWIVKNGIRLSGMPGYGEVETNANIWNLVRYVRSLSATPQKATAHE